MKLLLSGLMLTGLLTFAQLQAQSVYYQETFEGIDFGPSGGWYGYWNTDAQGGVSTGTYRESITAGASYAGAGNYLYAQTQYGDAMNYFLFDRDASIAITPDDHTELNVIWDRTGNHAPHFAVLIGTQWYITESTYSPTGTSPLNLKTATWTKLLLDPGNTLEVGTATYTYAEILAGNTITSVGFYVNSAAGSPTTITTTRFNNIEIYSDDVSSYTWQGNSGTGGTGNWDTVRSTEWNGLWRNHRTAIIGGTNDAGVGGTISLQANLGAAGLRFEAKGNDYTLQGAGAERILTLTGNIHVNAGINVNFGNNLIVTRSDANLNILGGGTLNLDNGATVRTTSSSGARYLAIADNSTVIVDSGANLTSQSSLIIGSTVTTGVSGDGTLIVDGGIVTTQSGGNFILGNRDNQVGDVVVTINSGEINVSGTASNGLIFENTRASSAFFNLNGGIVTTRRVRRNGTPTAGELTQFNFNGGVLRVDEVGGGTDAEDPNFDFLVASNNLSYRVLEGGAIIDTNGRDVRIQAPLVSAATNDGGFTKRGAGVLQLLGTNTYNGRTVIEEGTLSINNNNNLGGTQAGGDVDDGIIIYDDATLRIAGNVNIDPSARTLAIGNPDNGAGGGTATIEVTDNNTFTYSLGITQLADNTSLRKTGSGDMQITGISDYTGKTTIEEGSITLLNAGFYGGSLDSKWIDIGADAEFNVSDFEFSTMMGGYTFTAETLSGSGTVVGNTYVDNGLHIKIGKTSNGHQGMANLADAGDLTGTLTFQNDFHAGDSTIHYQLGGTSQGTEYDHLVINGTFDPTANTIFKVSWASGYVASYMDEFDLINWYGISSTDWNGFNVDTNLDLQDTLEALNAAGLTWDTSDFLEHGIIRVALVPEPSRALLLLLAFSCYSLRRRRNNL